MRQPDVPVVNGSFSLRVLLLLVAAFCFFCCAAFELLDNDIAALVFVWLGLAFVVLSRFVK